MSTAPHLSVTAVVPADPARVWAVLADYRDAHARIIPRPPFESLEVETGGIGAGTVIRVGIRMLGRRLVYRAAVTEPEPGRVLAETDLGNGTRTTFTVDPDPAGSRVTIATVFPVRFGVLGRLERALASRMLRPTYVRELALLAEVAGTGRAGVERAG